VLSAFRLHKCKCFWRRVSIAKTGSAQEYMINTLDPVMENTHLRDDNYFYYMPLMLKYNQNASGNPAYLTKEGFELLRAEPQRLDAIKIHTDYINNVLAREVADGELTKVILMDHLDWYTLLTQVLATRRKSRD
jgi:betaine lipid synthase